MKWLRKFFCPPTAYELGRVSSPDAHRRLPLGIFVDDPTVYTWEKWVAEVRRDYPVRFFLSETLPTMPGLLWRGVGDLWYWVKCKVHPEFRGYSILDLRKASPHIPYTHGWVDRSEALLYASFLCLRQYVEGELEHLEDISEGLRDVSPSEAEARALYRWWMEERHVEIERSTELFTAFDALRTTRHQEDPERVEAHEAWRTYRTWLEGRDDEMLLRLVRIRRSLWT